MARIDGGRAGVEGIVIPGLYGRIHDRESDRARTPDPRWVATEAAQRGDPCPPERMQNPLVPLDDLEAGRPVRLPWWMLGGHREPDERIRRMAREDRSISGWLLAPDDVAVPIRETGSQNTRGSRRNI